MALTTAASLRITPATLSLIAEIDEFKGAWRAIGRLARHTIKDHMKNLSSRGHLTLHGAGRGAWYGLT